jgi:hypothetical protein
VDSIADGVEEGLDARVRLQEACRARSVIAATTHHGDYLLATALSRARYQAESANAWYYDALAEVRAVREELAQCLQQVCAVRRFTHETNWKALFLYDILVLCVLSTNGRDVPAGGGRSFPESRDFVACEPSGDFFFVPLEIDRDTARDTFQLFLRCALRLCITKSARWCRNKKQLSTCKYSL